MEYKLAIAARHWSVRTLLRAYSVEVAGGEAASEGTMQPPSALLISDFLLPERYKLPSVLGFLQRRKRSPYLISQRHIDPHLSIV